MIPRRHYTTFFKANESRFESARSRTEIFAACYVRHRLEFVAAEPVKSQEILQKNGGWKRQGREGGRGGVGWGWSCYEVHPK